MSEAHLLPKSTCRTIKKSKSGAERLAVKIKLFFLCDSGFRWNFWNKIDTFCMSFQFFFNLPSLFSTNEQWFFFSTLLYAITSCVYKNVYRGDRFKCGFLWIVGRSSKEDQTRSIDKFFFFYIVCNPMYSLVMCV